MLTGVLLQFSSTTTLRASRCVVPHYPLITDPRGYKLIDDDTVMWVILVSWNSESLGVSIRKLPSYFSIL